MVVARGPLFFIILPKHLSHNVLGHILNVYRTWLKKNVLVVLVQHHSGKILPAAVQILIT